MLFINDRFNISQKYTDLYTSPLKLGLNRLATELTSVRKHFRCRKTSVITGHFA